VPIQIRVGLNSGKVVVGAIGNDLKMDYTALGQTVHLASRMEQMATPGSTIINDALQLAKGFESGRSLAEARTHDAAPISALPLVGRKAEIHHDRRGVAASVSPRITAWT
jgi:class 3 adenylate cyclase